MFDFMTIDTFVFFVSNAVSHINSTVLLLLISMLLWVVLPENTVRCITSRSIHLVLLTSSHCRNV